MPWYIALPVVFAVGAGVGRFIASWVERFPRGESLVWPPARCRGCQHALPWWVPFPLVGGWWSKNACPACGVVLPIRSAVMEWLVGLGWVGVWCLVHEVNVCRFDLLILGAHRFDSALVAVFLHRAILFAFLATIHLSSVEKQAVPGSLMVAGSAVGLLASLFWSWPWPYGPGEAALPPIPWWQVHPRVGPRQGLEPWPVWGPLPAGLDPGGNPGTGLVTSLAGLASGAALTVFARLAFRAGSDGMRTLAPVGALARNDLAMLMTAGSFLGWQAVLVASGFASVILAWIGWLCFLYRFDRGVPWSWGLFPGVMAACLAWNWIAPPLQAVLFHPGRAIALAALLLFVTWLAGVAVRLTRRFIP